MRLKPEELAFFIECVKPMLEYEPVKQMGDFVQHGNTSCLRHSLAVAFYSYCLCRKLRIKCDEVSMIRGAMLHDFFLYDWHIPDPSRRWHGFSHPKTALANAEKHFSLCDKEREVIVRHMWPLTLRIPRCREALLVCLVDKVCSAAEVLEFCPGNRFYTSLPVAD